MKRAIAILLVIPALAAAEITPRRGAYDPRVRIVDYNPENVVKITTFYGVSTHVQLGDGEEITDVASGDDQAWQVVKGRSKRDFFFKPKAEKADTNLTIITNKRSYQFALVVEPRPHNDSSAWRSPNLVYALKFHYPDEKSAARAAKEKAAEIKARLNGDARAQETAAGEAEPAGDNLDYWVAGSPEISPTAARDDGRFTYLTFSHNRDMPAVYTVDSEGNEALVNTNVEGNTIIVHRVVPRLTLRKGSYVACLRNKSFDFDGGRDNTTGTVAPEVQRVIKQGTSEE